MRSKEKSRRTAVLCCVLAAILLVVMALSVWVWSCTAGFYSERQHLSRIEGLAKKRYLSEGSEYTGLEVYPLYDENEEFHYALIELKPQGFVYVKIQEWALPQSSMYLKSGDPNMNAWRPYAFEKDVVSVIPGEDGTEETWEGRRYFRDENGEYITYTASHFAVAGIEGERRYFIPLVDDSGERRKSVGVFLAVKRGENYLNLISGREVPCSADLTAWALEERLEYDVIPFFTANDL